MRLTRSLTGLAVVAAMTSEAAAQEEAVAPPAVKQIAAMTSEAAAQEAAVAVPAVKQIAVAPRPHPHAALGAGLAFGAARLGGGANGWVGRLDFELLPVLAPPGKVGPIVGLQPALQAWGSDDGGGFGIPYAVVMGVRAPGLRVTGMLGVEVFFVDKIHDDYGFGLYAPFAGARAVFEHRRAYLGFDVRVTRRWQFGAADYTQWQASITVGGLVETPLEQPIR